MESVRQLFHSSWMLGTVFLKQLVIQPYAILDVTDFDAVVDVFKQAGDINGVVNCSGSLLLNEEENRAYLQSYPKEFQVRFYA